MRIRSYFNKLKLKLRLALQPLVQTWDTFWVRNVSGDLENRDDVLDIIWHNTNTNEHKFYYSEQDSYKASFVCEKDLD